MPRMDLTKWSVQLGEARWKLCQPGSKINVKGQHEADNVKLSSIMFSNKKFLVYFTSLPRTVGSFSIYCHLQLVSVP